MWEKAFQRMAEKEEKQRIWIEPFGEYKACQDGCKYRICEIR